MARMALVGLFPLSRVLLVACAVAGAVAPAARAEPPAEAPKSDAKEDPKEEAKRVYLEGKDAYSKGEFAEAARKWQRVHELNPTPELLFNIGRAHEQAGDAAQAVIFYERYLKESKEPRDKAVVEATIKRLQAQVPKKSEKSNEEEAAAHFKRGRELYQGGQYKDALAELQTAFDILPSATLVYNMAKTREKMGDAAGALKDYRTYLRMEPNAADKGDVEFLMKNLEKKARGSLNELSLESTPPGAEVYLDGSETLAGQTPLSVKISAGEHTLKVQKNGFEVASRPFTMPDDRDLTLTFELRPLENVGFLTVDCAQDGSHIFLDGTILALTPYKDRRALEAGKHQLVLEHEGYQRFVQVVDIQKGKETRLKVDLASNETRSKAPLVLAPLLGSVFGVVALTGALVSTGFAWQAARATAESRTWQLNILGLFIGEAVAVVIGLTGVVVTVGIISLWAVLGLMGGGTQSELTVRPAEGAAP